VKYILEYKAVVKNLHISCGENKIERESFKFLNYTVFILNIDHPHRDYYPVMNKLGLGTLVNIRKVVNNLTFLGN